MTTHKASFKSNNNDNTNNQSTTNQEGTQREGANIQSTSMGLAPSQEQMTAYLYGLLSEEESSLLQQRVEENDAYRDAMKASQESQALFAYWDDVPAPDGLAERALQQIQAQSSSEG